MRHRRVKGLNSSMKNKIALKLIKKFVVDTIHVAKMLSTAVKIKKTGTAYVKCKNLSHLALQSRLDLYLYITWQYALLCYRATRVTLACLARPVIIHDIIHDLIFAKYSILWIFWGLVGWKLHLRPLRFFYVQLKVSQTSHLIYDTTSLHACPSVYSTWCPRQSPTQLWTGLGVAQLQWSTPMN